ncbi:MAG: ABC transporter substrate-binding protein [Nocardioides sp.]|uniref:ABC transporter substrate-binding protein n=1 Tax=Nocardioides sp. TaxID=35761 RepID=UPI0039E62BCB
MPSRRRLRLVVATVLVASLGASLGACATGASSSGGTPVHGGVLHTLRANPFEGFDLDKGTLNSTYQISQAVLEPLVRVGDDGTSLAPGLARSWRYNKTGDQLTLHLQPRARFSNGKQLTAEDVKFSIRTWQSGPNYGATFADIKTIQIVNPKTLVLHLSGPDTTLIAFLSWANAGVVPQDFAGMSEADFWQHPIGAGPFTVEKWSGNGEVILKRNPHYYRKGLPYVDEIDSDFASDPNSVTLQIQSGEADMADEILPVTAATLPKNEVYAGPEHLTPVLLMNTKDGALADVDVRRAIANAIDYDAISNSALRGYGRSPRGALPTNLENWAAPSTPYFTHDVDKAKSYLASAGATPAHLSLIYPNDASSSVMALVIQDDLEQIGITVDLKQSDSATEFGAMSSGQYQLAIFSNNAISPDASDPAWYIAATNTMFTGYPTGKAFAILAAYGAATTPAEKKAQITKLQDLWTGQVPYVALANTPALEGVGAKVHGEHVTPWGVYYFDTIWKNQ